jgi:hypothetical protein
VLDWDQGDADTVKVDCVLQFSVFHSQNTFFGLNCLYHLIKNRLHHAIAKWISFPLKPGGHVWLSWSLELYLHIVMWGINYHCGIWS